MDRVGFEPTTLCLQGRRSSNWSYWPKFTGGALLVTLSADESADWDLHPDLPLVPVQGIEPRVSSDIGFTDRRPTVEPDWHKHLPEESNPASQLWRLLRPMPWEICAAPYTRGPLAAKEHYALFNMRACETSTQGPAL